MTRTKILLTVSALALSPITGCKEDGGLLDGDGTSGVDGETGITADGTGGTMGDVGEGGSMSGDAGDGDGDGDGDNDGDGDGDGDDDGDGDGDCNCDVREHAQKISLHPCRDRTAVR